MYCDKYCQGRSNAIDCASYTGDDKENCIKSCLDCRSPNKKFCYCPSIFPPPTGKQRSGLGAQNRMNGDIQFYSNDEVEMATGMTTEQDNLDEKTDIWFMVIIIVVIALTAIAVAVFCGMRYAQRRREASGSKGRESMQQPQMLQGGRGGSGPRPQSNMNPRSQRGRPAETEEDTEDY